MWNEDFATNLFVVDFEAVMIVVDETFVYYLVVKIFLLIFDFFFVFEVYVYRLNLGVLVFFSVFFGSKNCGV